jgi:DNA-binding transcriptional regulator PaaX
MTNDLLAKNKDNKTARIARKSLKITAMILIELLEKVEDMNFLRAHPWAGYSKSIRADRCEYDRAQRDKEKWQTKQAIKRLRERKFIKARKDGDRVVYELTAGGKVKALEIALRSSKYVFDEKICLVSFDFPEASRRARNHFRHFLKKIGFKFVQGSVWSSRRDVSIPMQQLINLLRIESWVKVYIVVK